jgi:hypothetical protein
MPRATGWAPALLPSRGGVTAHPSSLDRPCARRLRDLAVGMEECSLRGSNQRMTQGSEGLMFAEQVELPRAVVRFGYARLVVTAYLGEVGRLAGGMALCAPCHCHLGSASRSCPGLADRRPAEAGRRKRPAASAIGAAWPAGSDRRRAVIDDRLAARSRSPVCGLRMRDRGS